MKFSKKVRIIISFRLNKYITFYNKMVQNGKIGSKILDELLGYLKTNANDFSKNLGFSDTTKIYHIKNGRNNISSVIANLIVKKYPEINYSWLITGEGEMILEERLLKQQPTSPAIELLVKELLSNPAFVKGIKEIVKKEKRDYNDEEYKSVIEGMIKKAEKKETSKKK